MKLKKQVMEVLQQEITGRLKPGDELVVIGAVALEGTRLLAKDKKTMLEMRFSQGFIQDMLYARERYGVQDLTENGFVWKMAEAAGADVIYPMGEGGFLSGLWKVSRGIRHRTCGRFQEGSRPSGNCGIMRGTGSESLQAAL